MPLPPPILYQNPSHTITLIDIPTSIAHAQGTPYAPATRHLLSRPPPTAPYTTPEPKSEAARERLSSQNSGPKRDIYIALIRAALPDISSQHTGPWCHPRRTNQPADTETEASLPALLFGAINPVPARTYTITAPPAPPFFCSNYPGSYSNATSAPQSLTLHISIPTPTWRPQHINFHLPPFTTHTLHTIPSHPPHLNRASVSLFLLDPPWPNKSAGRSSAYPTTRTLDVLTAELVGLAQAYQWSTVKDGIVAVWITNKAAVRNSVLGRNGIFDAWGVTLVEEWIWVKITEAGEPVTPLDGAWRCPWEMLLVGRKGAPACEEPARRVIAGVPDLHSRKPCLKELLEPLLPGYAEREGPIWYNAWEIYARHLVAGWCSWGNEALKFNWDNYWI
ncbi:MT-A70-domain-containing protein [Trichodelitschia bisporula]|uniref:MT-A70-domain-containing protein n=1 Tax=Trichodelitschia bisporula TaxID=703511 RepID=A0A6G1HZR7_9PEZI|nr:MT-A70-domain-containing protein [Trichodelitschia bisporula]